MNLRSSLIKQIQESHLDDLCGRYGISKDSLALHPEYDGYANGQITVFDFDDCAYGPFLYDLADAWTKGVGWAQFERIPEARQEKMNSYFNSVLSGYAMENTLPFPAKRVGGMARYGKRAHGMNLFGKGFRFGILLQVAIGPVFVFVFAICMLLQRSAPEVVTSKG